MYLTYYVYFLVSLCIDGTAALIVKQGPFSLDDPKNYKVDIRVSDGGHPSKSSVSTVSVGVCIFCVCDIESCLRLFYH